MDVSPVGKDRRGAAIEFRHSFQVCAETFEGIAGGECCDNYVVKLFKIFLG